MTLYVLDEALDYLNGTHFANFDAYLESVLEENRNFEMILNEVDVKEVAKNIKETIRRLIERIKTFIANLTAKLKSMAIEKMCKQIEANIKSQKEQLKELNPSDKIKVASANILLYSTQVMSKLPSENEIGTAINGDLDLNTTGGSSEFNIKQSLMSAKWFTPALKLAYAITNKKVDIQDIAQVDVRTYTECLDNMEKVIKTVPNDFKLVIDVYGGLNDIMNKAYKEADNADKKEAVNNTTKFATKQFNMYGSIVKGLFRLVTASMAATNKTISSMSGSEEEKKEEK